MYACNTAILGQRNFLLLRYSSVCPRENGRRCIVWVARLWSPALLLTILRIIHDVAEPHTTKYMLSIHDARLFQNKSNACRNPERWVSKHGSSSMNTTNRRLRFLFLRSNNSASWVKASIHEVALFPLWPYRTNALWKASISVSREPSMTPVA